MTAAPGKIPRGAIERVKTEFEPDEVAVHMEVYRDNAIDNGVRPQLRASGLRTEPWLFVIDREGRVSTAIEGGFSVEELDPAVCERLLIDSRARSLGGVRAAQSVRGYRGSSVPPL